MRSKAIRSLTRLLLLSIALFVFHVFGGVHVAEAQSDWSISECISSTDGANCDAYGYSYVLHSTNQNQIHTKSETDMTYAGLYFGAFEVDVEGDLWNDTTNNLLQSPSTS